MNVKELQEMTQKAKAAQKIEEEKIRQARKEWDAKLEEEAKKQCEKKFQDVVGVVPWLCKKAAKNGENTAIIYTIGGDYGFYAKTPNDKDPLVIMILNWCKEQGLGASITSRITSYDSDIEGTYPNYTHYITVSW